MSGVIERIEVEIRDPFSLLVATRYEWKRRGDTALVSRAREWVGAPAEPADARLVDLAVFDSIVAHVASACSPPAGATPVPASEEGLAPEVGEEVVRLRVELAGGEEGWSRAWTGNDARAAAGPCADLIREAANDMLGAPTPRHPYWVDGEFGRLRIESSPPAWVWLDGRPTFEQTPIDDLPAEPGEHELEWVSVVDGARRREVVRVELGLTTAIRVVIESGGEDAGEGVLGGEVGGR